MVKKWATLMAEGIGARIAARRDGNVRIPAADEDDVMVGERVGVK